MPSTVLKEGKHIDLMVGRFGVYLHDKTLNCDVDMNQIWKYIDEHLIEERKGQVKISLPFLYICQACQRFKDKRYCCRYCKNIERKVEIAPWSCLKFKPTFEYAIEEEQRRKKDELRPSAN